VIRINPPHGEAVEFIAARMRWKAEFLQPHLRGSLRLDFLWTLISTSTPMT